MTWRHFLALTMLIAAFGLGSGCDEETTDPDGGTPMDGSMPPDGATPLPTGFDAYIAATCVYADRCTSEVGPGFGSVSSCEVWYADYFDCILSDLFESLGLAFTSDETALAACVSWIETAPCTGSFADSPCATVFGFGSTGTGVLGDTCEQFPPTCADGLYCRQDFGSCSACTSEGSLGDDCSERNCADGLRCDRDTQLCAALATTGGDCGLDRDCASGVCLMGVCIEPQAAGAACSSGGDCASELCIADVCAAPVPFGGACTDTQQCGGFRVCRAGVCADRSLSGESCSAAADCLYDHWCISGTCELAGTCRELPLGGSCDLGLLTFCGDGAWCNRETGVCEATVGVGVACTAPDECGDTARCDTTSGTCLALQPTGGACMTRLDCLDDGMCRSDMTCQPLLANGVICSTSRECESSYCDSISGNCEDLPACAPL